MKKPLLTLSTFLGLLANATTYYISPSGNDNTGSGTMANPWATLYKATSTVSGTGDIIHVNAGTYTETQQAQLAVGVSIEGDGANLSILKSTLTAAWTEMLSLISSTEGTPGNQHISNLKFDGQNLSTFWAIHIIGRSNVSIYNCIIVDFNDRGVIFDGRTDNQNLPPVVYATGNSFHDNIVDNCAEYDGYNGIYGRGCLNIGGQDGMLIYNNTISQTSRPLGHNGWPIKGSLDGYLKGCKIYNNTLNKIPFHGTYGGDGGWDFAIELFNEQGLEIYNNTISGGAIDLNFQSKGAYAYSVWIHDNNITLPAISSSNNDAVIMEFSTEYAIVENNVIDKMSNAFLFTPRPGDSLTHITIRKNLCTNVNKNVGNGTNASWINCGPGATDFSINDFNVYNNTFLSDPTNRPWWGIELGAPTTGSMKSINIKNNILSGVYSGAIVQGGVVADNINISNNDIYNILLTNDPVWTGTPPTNYTYTNNIHVTPLFVSTTDFHLQNGSPCIDAGINVSLPYNGLAPDMGCYEYGVIATDVKELEKSSVSVYPNPTNNIITINTNNIRVTNVELFDVLGNLVMIEKINEKAITISLNALAKGIYIVKINTEHNSITKKIIKE